MNNTMKAKPPNVAISLHVWPFGQYFSLKFSNLSGKFVKVSETKLLNVSVVIIFSYSKHLALDRSQLLTDFAQGLKFLNFFDFVCCVSTIVDYNRQFQPSCCGRDQVSSIEYLSIINTSVKFYGVLSRFN